MFTLTPFAPTATPAARPIPPLASGSRVDHPGPLPRWIEALSLPPGGEVPLASFEGICVAPAGDMLDECCPALGALFHAGERARDHLAVRVTASCPPS